MEKAITKNMSLYEILTMLVPGALIVYCVWLLEPDTWRLNLAAFHYTADVNYLYDVVIGLMVFALAYVAGLLNYMVIDWFWGLLGLRNNSCVITNFLQEKRNAPDYKHLTKLIEQRENEWSNTKDDTNKKALITDIYDEAYTYASEHNTRSNVPHLENQVAMLKGLIVPLSWIVARLFPWKGYEWLAIIVVVSILVVLAVVRQKKTITLVFEDYEYEKRIEEKNK